MTDLHTHILPQMDDGAKSLEESLLLLEAERQQGVDTVVLTPHFYRERESVESFLDRRQKAMETLCAAMPAGSPRLIPGAEVAWFSSLGQEPQLEKLCLGNSRYLLLELPYAAWSKHLVDQVYQFANSSGLTPVLAHVERYLPLQKPDQVRRLLSLGLPMQMSADALMRPFGKRKMLALLERGEWYIGTDCHNTDTRKPNMEGAAKCLYRHLPGPIAQAMLGWQESPF